MEDKKTTLSFDAGLPSSEMLAFMSRIGVEATRNARLDLLAKGVKPVVLKRGQILEVDE